MQYVRDTLGKYDFVGVVERFDESLVALQLLMGLETSDILYFSSRLHTGYSGQFIRGHDLYICQASVDPNLLRSAPVDSK